MKTADTLLRRPSSIVYVTYIRWLYSSILNKILTFLFTSFHALPSSTHSFATVFDHSHSFSLLILTTLRWSFRIGWSYPTFTSQQWTSTVCMPYRTRRINQAMAADRYLGPTAYTSQQLPLSVSNYSRPPLADTSGNTNH